MATVRDKYSITDELGGGRNRVVIGMKPVNYLDAGSWRAIVNDFKDSGIVGRPHLVSSAPFMVSIDDEGDRRIHPTKDLDRYIEIGTPYVKPSTSWVKVGFTGATRTGNVITWSRAQADLSIAMAGHFIKLSILLKGGYNPGQIAFPVGMQGLTRTGNIIYADGVPVMYLNAPHVEDLDNPLDVRPITSQFVKLAGQDYILFTLPSLAGMSRPLVDPTLTLQPDATAGVDTIMGAHAPDFNYGSNAAFAIGEQNDGEGVLFRGLLKFDLSTLPDTATLSSSIISLTVTEDRSDNARTVRCYRVRRAWVEAQATWNSWSTGNVWSTAGCGDTTNDREASEIGNFSVGTGESVGTIKTCSLTATTKAELDLGNGFIFISDTELNDCYYYASSDHTTAGERPKLALIYTVPSVSSFRSLLGVGR